MHTIHTVRELDNYKRFIGGAKDEDRVAAMTMNAMTAESKKEMQQLMVMLYFTDLSYDRGDLCLAMKITEYEKGWRG